MFRLAAMLYVLVATALGGTAVMVVLILHMMERWQIAGAFATGCVLALPASYLLAAKIYAAINNRPAQKA
ncbi:MAG: hypothetical protein ACOH2J_03415 [Allorhizobium sp.]